MRCGAPTPDVALANHLVMGPAILARGLAGRVPYAVKVHGSALEYTVRPHPSGSCPTRSRACAAPRRAGRARATRRRASGRCLPRSPGCRAHTRLGPPGVDVHAFRPRPPRPQPACRAGRAPGRRGAQRPGAARRARRRRCAASTRAQDRIVSYVGKLIVSKGVDLLLAAWPLVVARVPEARLVIVGFGTYRETLGRFVDALRRARRRATWARSRRAGGARGRAARRAARTCAAFAGAAPEPRSGCGPRRRRAERVHFTGRLEHEDLPDLVPACEAQVMPSTFPEAFGMVAAEAAACGALPLSADHSGMAEVTAALAPAAGPSCGPLLSFDVGPDAVEQIAAKLVRGSRSTPPSAGGPGPRWRPRRPRRYSWESVAEGVIAAAAGRLDALLPVRPCQRIMFPTP